VVTQKNDDPYKVMLYTNIGCEMRHYCLDMTEVALVPKSSTSLPSIVQCAVPHVSRRYMYVACSSQRMEPESPHHCLMALRIDAQTGCLHTDGEPVELPARPIHLTTDILSENILVAFNSPSGLRIFSINSDFTIGCEIPQPGLIDRGFYAHQIRVTPDNRHAILVTRGSDAMATRPEDPGALKMFDYEQGVLSNGVSVAPNGGFGFGPRHLDFHPSGPWVYVVLERQNEVETYRLEDGSLTARAVFRCSTLADPEKRAVHQLASAIQVHPNGHYLYVSNRADGVVDFRGKKVFAGGENNIAVYSINQATGEPTALQFIDTPRISPRSFDIEPGGRLMVVHNNIPANIREGEDVKAISAGMSVYRIGHDGKLTYVRTYDLEGGKYTNYWLGIVQLP
jgi:6-phosphogluconolactonase (cycloisomerase 2 family)